jgi:eukaryotic-like serine/threonine-protein kinase
VISTADPREIGGYRLVRRLAASAHTVTWLAHGDESVVLRVFRPAASDARIDAEICARERLSGTHVPRLIDIATDSDGRPVPVVTSVLGPALDELLPGEGAVIRLGHLTTILAPLARLLEEAHDHGVVLGRLDARSVRIDSSGTPVLVSLGDARVAPVLPERLRPRDPAIMQDRRRLIELAGTLAGFLGEPERLRAQQAIESASARPGELELALFDLAAPVPLGSLTAPQVAVSVGAPSSGLAGSSSASEGPIARLGHAVGLAPSLLDPIDDAREGFLRGVRGFARTVSTRVSHSRPRRAIVITGIAGIAAMVLALGLLSAQTSGEPEREPEQAAASSSSPGEALGSKPTQRPVTEQRPLASTLPETVTHPALEQWGPLVAELIDRWAECERAASEECVALVTHEGSAAADQLRARGIATGPSSPWASASGREVLVTDQLGSAVIAEVLHAGRRTASLLVMRGEAGWRLRAVMIDSDP